MIGRELTRLRERGGGYSDVSEQRVITVLVSEEGMMDLICFLALAMVMIHSVVDAGDLNAPARRNGPSQPL